MNSGPIYLEIYSYQNFKFRYEDEDKDTHENAQQKKSLNNRDRNTLSIHTSIYIFTP